jgi:hypothetical protein
MALTLLMIRGKKHLAVVWAKEENRITNLGKEL